MSGQMSDAKSARILIRVLALITALMPVFTLARSYE